MLSGLINSTRPQVRPSRALAMSHKSRRAGTRAAVPASISDTQITHAAIAALSSSNALTASTSSGYSTSDETATTTTAVAAASQPTPTKSTKRKTRASTTSSSPLLNKRIRVDGSPTEQPPPSSTTVATATVTSDADAGGGANSHPSRGAPPRPNVVCTKPPLPPAKGGATSRGGVGGQSRGSNKQQVNGAAVMNKLKAYADQCRTEIGELKVALANEKAAVRTLRYVVDTNSIE